jgi:2-haloacid dehalogenase
LDVENIIPSFYTTMMYLQLKKHSACNSPRNGIFEITNVGFTRILNDEGPKKLAYGGDGHLEKHQTRNHTDYRTKNSTENSAENNAESRTKYRTLLFDADDTLLDFGAAEKLALRLLFQEQDIPLTDEIEANYKQINHRLWKAFEDGEMSRDEVVNTRFSILFREYGEEVDGPSLEKAYRLHLDEGHELIAGSRELIENLQSRFGLYIVTNGLSRTQDRRLRDSGIYPKFKGIFVSEDTGYQKPMKEFFDYVFARIPNFAAESCLMIGDSLNSDIKGGQLAGLDTCWFNPAMKPNETDIIPTYEIHKLEELYGILGRMGTYRG